MKNATKSILFIFFLFILCGCKKEEQRYEITILYNSYGSYQEGSYAEDIKKIFLPQYTEKCPNDIFRIHQATFIDVQDIQNGGSIVKVRNKWKAPIGIHDMSEDEVNTELNNIDFEKLFNNEEDKIDAFDADARRNIANRFSNHNVYELNSEDSTTSIFPNSKVYLDINDLMDNVAYNVCSSKSMPKNIMLLYKLDETMIFTDNDALKPVPNGRPIDAEVAKMVFNRIETYYALLSKLRSKESEDTRSAIKKLFYKQGINTKVQTISKGQKLSEYRSRSLKSYMNDIKGGEKNRYDEITLKAESITVDGENINEITLEGQKALSGGALVFQEFTAKKAGDVTYRDITEKRCNFYVVKETTPDGKSEWAIHLSDIEVVGEAR